MAVSAGDEGLFRQLLRRLEVLRRSLGRQVIAEFSAPKFLASLVAEREESWIEMNFKTRIHAIFHFVTLRADDTRQQHDTRPKQPRNHANFSTSLYIP